MPTNAAAMVAARERWARGDLRLLSCAVLVAISLGCQRDTATPVEPHPGPLPIVIIPDSAPNAVARDNALPGTTRWHEYGNQPSLPVYATPYAPRRGDTLYVHANSNETGEGSVEIYRLGWYGGMGGRLIHEPIPMQMQNQPACTPSSPPPAECRWTGTPITVVDQNWLAGVYMLRVNGPAGEVGFYPFVVSSTHQRSALAVIPQFTWQAYNAYAGASLYSIDPSTGMNAVKVSFERPYDFERGLLGSEGSYSGFGFKALRFLEREGIDLGYVSDLDLTDSTRSIPPGFKALIFLGHSEYWTWEERLRVESYLAQKTHLAFFTANNSYWRVRLQSSGITGTPDTRIVCYKNSVDLEAVTPDQTTTLFRRAPLSRPENQLIGIMYSSLLPAGTVAPFLVAPDSVRGAEGQAFLQQAGLQAGDTLGIDTGTEVDQVVNNTVSPAGLQVLLTNRIPVGTGYRTFQSTFYIAPSGAGVFATGTNHWEQYLDGTTDPRVEGLTKAVLNWMLSH